MKSMLPALLAFSLAACATSSPHPDEAGEASREEQTFTDIASTPLSDLNLTRVKIPSILLAARKSPYAPPEDASCDGIGDQVRALNIVLGVDLDAPPKPDNAGTLERGATFVGEAALGAVRGAAEGIMPFRSWIRKLTGAERHSREVAAAITAGTVRRAFLKGLGQAAGCPPPAAPCKPGPEENQAPSAGGS